MSGFASAGFAALNSFKGKIAEYRRDNASYHEFAGDRSRDNKGFEDERGYSRHASFDSIPEPERPPLRHIDTYIKPELPCLSKRYTVAVLACVGFIISFGMRLNMGTAKIILKNSTEVGNSKFNWSIGTESAMDSSFFWGYLITQVPGGFLASLYPANKVFGLAIATSSFLNLLVPGALILDPVMEMIVQIGKGLVEGVTYPACHGIWKYWAPPLERSRLATLAFCGSYAAMVIGMPLTSILSYDLGWSASFYFYGIAGLIWYCLWLWLAFEKPSLHPCISGKELKYIEDSLGQGQGQVMMPMPTFATTPWRSIATSMPVYAIIVANFCRSWNFYLLVLFQNRFLHESFKMNLLETGFLGSLPHLLMTVIVPLGGLLADHLRKRGIMTTTNVRKLFNCGGFGMEALFFLVVANAASNSNGGAATAGLTIGVACSGFAISGFNVNHLDIAPRYASILMGLSNGIGTIAGLFVPIFVDHVTQTKDPNSWRTVFIVAACVHFFGVAFYAFFCSGEIQPWADSSVEEQKAWNPLGELSQTGPPVRPPPMTMQSEFITQPSLDGTTSQENWNASSAPPQHNEFYSQEKIEAHSTANYGATESSSVNPFHSTNPFVSGVNASYVQPSTTDDNSYDVMQNE